MALPPRWRMMCATARKGVVASQYGLFGDRVEGCEDERGKPYWTGGYEYMVSSVEWLKCAKAGCCWCRFLERTFLTGLERRSQQWRSEEVHVRVGRDSKCFCSEEEIVIIVNGMTRGFTLYALEGDPAARWIKDRIIIWHVGSRYALAMAKACIEECARDHPMCQAITPYPIGHAPLPTRLIDCSDPDCVRLVEAGPRVRGAYVALSYVWGEDQPHRTTEANLSSYKIRIDPAILPQTILDAIHVTRALGISLLWLDGLCIVQDSEKDMHHELARMRDVYRHAFVTIDASSAAKVSDGFLQDREPHPIPDAVLPFICPPSNQADPLARGARVGVVYAVQCRIAGLATEEGTPYKEPRSHTLKRGWCLQETLLSTRLLVFTARTLQLRCHTKTQNVGGAKLHGHSDVPRLPGAVFHPNRHVTPGSIEWIDIHQQWRRIVQHYTRRELTNSSDKLVAISALAEMFKATLGPDYLAGLWRHSLIKDLLWKSDSPRSLRPTGYRGPSWSWVSATKHVGWCQATYKEDRPLAKVVKCTVTLYNQELPFGPVTGASLILRSRLFPCKRFHNEVIYGVSVRSLFLDLPPSLSFPLEVRTDFDEDASLLKGREVWFLPLMMGFDFSQVWIVGLAVTRAEIDVWPGAGAQREGDVYRRVAMACCWIRKDHADFIQRIRAMLTLFLTVDIELV